MANSEARQVSNYWNRIASEFDAIYSGEKNAISRTLDKLLRRDMYQRFDWVMCQAGNIRGATVCDVGCGTGRFVSALAKRGAQVTGLDFAPKMLELARELTQSEAVSDRCKFVLGDVLDWSTGEKFDLVIAIGLFDYIADPLPRLRVIRGLTSGRFLSAWPRAGTLRAAIRKLRLKVAGCPVYFWCQDEIENYLHQARFRVVSVKVLGQLNCVEAQPV